MVFCCQATVTNCMTGVAVLISAEIDRWGQVMVHRKSLVQRRFWLRKELLNKLEREAKKNDRPLTEEMAVRLERSFERQDWQQERENWIVAIRSALESHPDASEAALMKLKELDDKAELEAHQDLKSDLRKGGETDYLFSQLGKIVKGAKEAPPMERKKPRTG
jgi:hypothetical protein